MESSAWLVCTGSWWKHKVKGKLQYRYVYVWRTVARADSGWEYYDDNVQAYLSRYCGDSGGESPIQET